MNSFVGNVQYVKVFLLYFVRCVVFFSFFYVTRRLPTVGKNSFALIIGFIIFFANAQITGVITEQKFAFLLIVNGGVGYLLATLLSVPFFVIEMNGKLMDTLRGETIGDTLGRSSFIDKNSSLFNLLTISFLAYFISANGLILVFKMLYNSFVMIPVDRVQYDQMLQNIIYALKQLYIWFALISLPGIAVSMLIDLMFSFPSVGAPSINIFTISFPVKSFAISVLYFFFLPVLFTYMIKYFDRIILLFG